MTLDMVLDTVSRSPRMTASRSRACAVKWGSRRRERRCCLFLPVCLLLAVKRQNRHLLASRGPKV